MEQQGQMMQSILMIVVMIAIFYFFLIRPQKKRQKKHQEMIESISRGDEVVTAGGFWGTVRDFKDDSVILEIAPGVKTKVLKSSVSTKVTPMPVEEKPAEEKKATSSDAGEKKSD